MPPHTMVDSMATSPGLAKGWSDESERERERDRKRDRERLH